MYATVKSTNGAPLYAAPADVWYLKSPNVNDPHEARGQGMITWLIALALYFDYFMW